MNQQLTLKEAKEIRHAIIDGSKTCNHCVNNARWRGSPLSNDKEFIELLQKEGIVETKEYKKGIEPCDICVAYSCYDCPTMRNYASNPSLWETNYLESLLEE